MDGREEEALPATDYNTTIIMMAGEGEYQQG